MKNDIASASKSKRQPIRKGPGIKILIGIVLIGISISSILYGPTLADSDQEIGAKVGKLALLTAGIHLIVSGVKRWNKN